MSLLLESALDESRNFVSSDVPRGMVESRYVRRHPDYFIVYISSQTGCRKACRMCHLTQTAQVQADDLPVTAIVDQAREVLGWYDAHAEPAKVVHFNFMARGEPFANPHILTEGGRLMASLSEEALKRRLVPRVKFSSIFPHELTDVDRLATLFGGYTPDIYYSIYSMDAGFRRRWLPKALPPETSLEMLKEYQSQTRKIPVLHFAFIAGENDSTDNIEEICAAVNRIKLRVDLNIVRYNPHSARTGAEPSEDVIHRNAALFERLLPTSRIKVVPRVGFDVKASCGMFVASTASKGSTAAPVPSPTSPSSTA